MKNIYVWLIENGKSGEDLKYRYFRDGWTEWTTDPYKALWLSRREDAESVAAEDDEAMHIVEHGFEITGLS